MEESILLSIKKALGIAESDEYFDQDIIMHINTVLSTLTQIGVGPEEGMFIEDDGAEWYDLIGDVKNLELVKTYVFMKVKLIFDPPSSGTVLESYNKMISELEWRINTTVDKQ